jgi:very-short-patch-repair endonuclease
MRDKETEADLRVARIAGRQHGNVTIRQLLDAGLSRDGVGRRVRKGALHRVHRGVYRVGHRAPSTKARYIGAVLACGDEAVLSGRAAAFLLRLIRGAEPGPEVSVPSRRRVLGVETHWTYLHPLDTSTHHEIPITTVPRTLLDLAAHLSLDDLAYAAHQAEVLHKTKPAHVDATITRRPNAPGAARLRALFHGDTPVILSRLERAFLAVLKRHGLPLPQTNRRAGGRYVDCRWPEHRLTVELDSFTFHHSRHTWERDRRREREARSRGDEFRRYTWADVTEDTALMLAELRALLPMAASPR